MSDIVEVATPGFPESITEGDIKWTKGTLNMNCFKVHLKDIARICAKDLIFISVCSGRRLRQGR